MDVAILTFDGFNEIDTFLTFNILNRIKDSKFNVKITSPSKMITSMNGVSIEGQRDIDFANNADVVLFGSGVHTREIIKDKTFLSQLSLNADKQLIAGQCSGVLFMAELGLLNGLAVSTDLSSKQRLEEIGVEVLNQPFTATGNIATAGGCLSSQYMAAWVIANKLGNAAAEYAMGRVAPTGEQEKTVAHCLSVIEAFINT